jgi:hypothetical protein
MLLAVAAIKSADVGADMGNPKGTPYPHRQGPRYFGLLYGKEYNAIF